MIYKKNKIEEKLMNTNQLLSLEGKVAIITGGASGM